MSRLKTLEANFKIIRDYLENVYRQMNQPGMDSIDAQLKRAGVE